MQTTTPRLEHMALTMDRVRVLDWKPSWSSIQRHTKVLPIITPCHILTRTQTETSSHNSDDGSSTRSLRHQVLDDLSQSKRQSRCVSTMTHDNHGECCCGNSYRTKTLYNTFLTRHKTLIIVLTYFLYISGAVAMGLFSPSNLYCQTAIFSYSLSSSNELYSISTIQQLGIFFSNT